MGERTETFVAGAALLVAVFAPTIAIWAGIGAS